MKQLLKRLSEHPYAAPLVEPSRAVRDFACAPIMDFIRALKSEKDQNNKTPGLIQRWARAVNDSNAGISGAFSGVIGGLYAGFFAASLPMAEATGLIGSVASVLATGAAGMIAGPFILAGTVFLGMACAGCMAKAPACFIKGCRMALRYRKDPQGYMAALQPPPPPPPAPPQEPPAAYPPPPKIAPGIVADRPPVPACVPDAAQGDFKAGWDQSAFDLFQAGRDPDLVKKDEEKLAGIFNRAAAVPIAKEALDWAQKHGVRFFIDHQCTGVSGYHAKGMGIVGIAVARLDDGWPDLLGTIVHEVRHAWQNWQGMSQTVSRDFAEYYIRLALVEADASAFGDLAKYQAEHAASPDEGFLWKRFSAWFNPWSGPAWVYGDAALKAHGEELGFSSIAKEDRNYAFRPYSDKPAPFMKGLDIDSLEEVCRLGRAFNSNANYFRQKDARDVLLKKILRPERAVKFYMDFLNRPAENVSAIRKRHLALRRENVKAGKGDYYI